MRTKAGARGGASPRNERQDPSFKVRLVDLPSLGFIGARAGGGLILQDPMCEMQRKHSKVL